MNRKAEYTVTDDGTFIIENYNHAVPYANFLPGYAGRWGKPIWAYYVNRCQGMATFGVRDKDHAILEFDSANLHYRRIFQEGFRTFIKLKDKNLVYEPFTLTEDISVKNRLKQTASSLTLEETSGDLQLKIRVTYFTIPNEDFGALVRRVKMENLADRDREFSILDGLPKIVPYERNHFLLKFMPFITDGYLQIDNLEQGTPYFTLASIPTDEAETEFVAYGNFCIGFSEDEGKIYPTEKIVDPKLIFDEYLDFARAYRFEDTNRFSPKAHQDTICQTPCAFNYADLKLGAHASIEINSIFGAARGKDELEAIGKSVMVPGFLDNKEEENRQLVNKLMDSFLIHSGDKRLNNYVRQSFLDNTLRGGYPIILDSKGGKVPFYAFSRLHGDLERDYNNFILEPTFFSCGNGRFRDVNQNRRNDSWLKPAVGTANIKHFFNLIQLDGYNPLVCGNQAFRIESETELSKYINQNFDQDGQNKIKEFLSTDFTPGDYANFLKVVNFKSESSYDELVNGATAIAKVVDLAQHETGYWSDHWMYNFDLLFRYLDLYPDKAEEILLRDTSYTYFDTEYYVKNRNERYVVYRDGSIRHLISVGVDNEKAALIASRSQDAHLVRTDKGRGRIYRTSLMTKIISLITLKMATLSASGLGIDMEGGRPGWCDSVNGLPSLFGSELPAQYKLHAVLTRLDDITMELDATAIIQLPQELYKLMTIGLAASEEFLISNSPLSFWQKCNAAKEQYRHDTRMGVSGREEKVELGVISKHFMSLKIHLERNLENGFDDKYKLPVTFMTHRPTSYQKLTSKNAKGLPCVEVTDFASHKFAPFLEGSVFRMEYEKDFARKKQLYKQVKSSPLYDQNLGFYKIAVDLDTEPKEQGRTGGWPKGWFENESVFMHVQYKYLLQLLQGGLYDEFFSDLRQCFPIYQDPAIYGRSPFENVSFITPSTHLRPSYHGRGMQARLTGTNSEVLHMMLLISFGHQPFTYKNGQLHFTLQPLLDEALFTTEESCRAINNYDGSIQELITPVNAYIALFLGKSIVTYHNPKRQKSYGKNRVKPIKYIITMDNNEKHSLHTEIISGDLAHQIREGKAKTIDVELG